MSKAAGGTRAKKASLHGDIAAAAQKSFHPGPRTGEIRVLCVDDHAVLVEGLKAQFAIEGRVRVVGRLASAEGLLDAATQVHPHVVLLDIEMPGPDAFEMADRLRHMHPDARVVFLSAHIRDGYISSAYKCGAWGYFAKSDDLEDISSGVIAVAQNKEGTFVLGPKVRERCRPPGHGAALGFASAPKERQARPSTPLDSLTTRELEVLRMIGRGMSRLQIAEELCRSAKTIDGHQERILKKLRIDSRAELMRFAIREGLAPA